MLFCPVFANQNSRRSTSLAPAAQRPLHFRYRHENFATATPFSRPFFSSTSALFHFPYLATLLFATLTKTTGVYTNNSHSETRPSPLTTDHCIQVLSFHILPHSFALIKNSTLFFSILPPPFHNNTRTRCPPSLLP